MTAYKVTAYSSRRREGFYETKNTVEDFFRIMPDGFACGFFFLLSARRLPQTKGGDGVCQSWKELEGKRIGERYSRRNVIFPGLRLPLRRNAPKVLTFLNPIMYAGQLSPC